MKKSNALMISYILILISTIAADSLIAWDGIDQIALAATVAGCFFAIADFWGWAASFGFPMVNAQKECNNTYKHYLEEILHESRKDRSELYEAVGLLKPYANSHASVNELIDASKDLASVIEIAETTARESLIEVAKEETDLKKREKRIVRQKWYEIIFATCGFFIFFILLVFDVAVEVLLPLGSFITVITFAVIMLNYFLKDVLEDTAKKEVADLNTVRESVRQRTSAYKEEIVKVDFMQATKDVISKIKKYENAELNAESE